MSSSVPSAKDIINKWSDTINYILRPQAPVKFISMDLIGEFHPPSSKGNRYTLTVICMNTGFVFCIPLKTKSTEDVV